MLATATTHHWTPRAAIDEAYIKTIHINTTWRLIAANLQAMYTGHSSNTISTDKHQISLSELKPSMLKRLLISYHLFTTYTNSTAWWPMTLLNLYKRKWQYTVTNNRGLKIKGAKNPKSRCQMHKREGTEGSIPFFNWLRYLWIVGISH